MKRFLSSALLLAVGLHATAALAAPLTITSTTVPTAIGGVAYSTTLTATGGTSPYTWTVQSGGLPPGLTLTSATGVISGTPSTSSWVYTYPFNIYVYVKDAKGTKAYATIATPVVAPSSTPTTPPPTTPPPTTTPPTTPPVTPPSNATYGLSVVNGSGSGSYLPGTVVTITATAAPAGQTFSQWTGSAVANATSATTTVTTVASNSTVTATFVALPPPPPTPPAAPTNPILFVTQVPVGMDFSTVGSVFSNHRPGVDSAARGGDLYIRYPDGSLRNLTAEAGFGSTTVFQGANSIAVREPSVHWNGQKAVFSMVVGAPATANASNTSMWQLYEVTGLAQGQTATITKVANQPAYNNVAPCYGTDGRIIFSSDRPRNGQSHLYPQLDEYELAPTTTGLWSLDPVSGDLFNLDHTPSGAFSPSVDSFGRVVFVRWDHLQRDQEADIDNGDLAAGRAPTYGTFNYSDESSSASVLAGVRTEVFPEPRAATGNTTGHIFNFFFPWMIAENGTGEETINHIGRHELAGYIPGSIIGDNSIGTFSLGATPRFNFATYLNNFIQLREDPLVPGRYLGTDGPEFSTHASGQLLSITAPAGLDADHIQLAYITDPIGKTSSTSSAHTGHFRDPLPLSNGTLVAVHTAVTTDESKRSIGSDYDFRLKTLWQNGTYWEAYQTLTPGFTKTVSFYLGGSTPFTYSGPLWELNPVEVRARPIPQAAAAPLATQEQQVFDEEGVNVATFQSYLRANNLAVVVSRNVTTRDHAEKQQPYNLRIAGTNTKTVGTGGTLYDVGFLQFFQGDQIRGFGLRSGTSTPSGGRRVLAQPLHDDAALAANPAAPGGPAGSVQLGTDGSMAAFLPARRATTWQLTDTAGAPVVRERYWLTFQPGEIRSCTSCHGINTTDQANHPVPTNKPEALRTLLKYWKAQTGN